MSDKSNVSPTVENTDANTNISSTTTPEAQTPNEVSNFKEWGAIALLFIASFISVFGIYNVFHFSLVDSINNIPVLSERLANYALLSLFAITMFVMSTIYWKKKDFFSKMQVLGFLSLILIIMIGIMALWIHNFAYSFVALVILGITFFLFNMLFNTIGLVGVFFSVSLFSVLMVFMMKMGVGTTASSVFTIVQTFIALLLFLGTTYPRIRSMLFKIGTRDNVEMDGSMQTSSDNDDGEDD